MYDVLLKLLGKFSKKFLKYSFIIIQEKCKNMRGGGEKAREKVIKYREIERESEWEREIERDT